jgi:hypothetical protein
MTKPSEIRAVPAVAVEAGALVVAGAILAIALRAYGYSDTLHEYDLYATVIGLWHADAWGGGLASPMHYYVWLCFGYLQFIDAVAGADGLADRPGIIETMNAVGFWSTIAIPLLCWLALRVAYGVAAATAATLLFVLSPIFLDLAGTAHPLMPALACYFAGAAFMLFGREGLARIGLWSAATLCLALALLFRFEVAFAFPFLVLAQPRTESFRAFVSNAALRCVPGVAALALYFLAQRAMLGSNAVGETGAFLDQWYSLANLGKGVVAAALAAGVALSLAAAFAVTAHLVTLRKGFSALASWAAPHAVLLAPLGVVGAALLFWLPNPLPARHFLLFTFGVSVFVALAFRDRLSAGSLVGGAVAIVVANQIAAVFTGPLIARLSPSEMVSPVGVLLPAPAEPALARRAILKARSEEARDLARQIADHTCATRLVVITSQAPMLIVEMLREGRRPQVELASGYSGAFRYLVYDDEREVVFFQREGAAESTGIVPAVLADPDYADAAVFIDPMTRHHADTSAPAPARAESFTCARSSGAAPSGTDP